MNVQANYTAEITQSIFTAYLVTTATSKFLNIPPNRPISFWFLMDICLIGNESGAQVLPKSVLGILWLQTHFDKENWDTLADGRVILPMADLLYFAKDAKEAGLVLSQVPMISIKKLLK